ncbi:hypothetical protein G3495_03785 [Shewanella baltica]|uniref:hypothetical protein n=1 Tax=Shewanella baltica TaxID=62322 RepID=UPI00217F1504|nr:hypothetical protein [Shewanella baltica]MCS6234260.1 hypothetical protein [Shewanella baltica]MCS6258328.1 hypothetical protein [Shewanella baltica]MCS6270908.1 hypothetical protein [Shewanella baltica]
MNLFVLIKKAKLAKEGIVNSNVLNVNKPFVTSMLNQIDFIIQHAEKGNNPILQLKAGQTFTYSVLASRELSSPDELKIKELLDDVSEEMYSSDY